MDDTVDLGLGPAPLAPQAPTPISGDPSKSGQWVKLALMALSGAMGPGAGTGLAAGLAQGLQRKQERADYLNRQNQQTYDRQQQDFARSQQLYQQQAMQRQQAVAQAYDGLAKLAPSLKTRADFDAAALRYSSLLNSMGIRVPPQALAGSVPYAEPSERDAIASGFDALLSKWKGTEALKHGLPLNVHIEYTDPLSGQKKVSDKTVGDYLRLGYITAPVTADGSFVGAKPEAPKPGTPREGMVNGRNVFWTMGPDGQPQVVPGVTPTPPASQSAGSGPGTLPSRVQQRVDAKGKEFNSQPVVRRVQQMAEAVTFADSMNPNTNNPADDQALIYAFAKAMDPDSVVREGEYATVQKYAQSWAQTFGFNAARIFSNTAFLSPQVRSNMKATIRAKYASAIPQYRNVRKNYVQQVDQMLGKPGSGDEWILDYEAAFPQTQTDAPATDATSAASRARQRYHQRNGGVQ